VQHVERLESAFLRVEVAPTANLSRPFESAVAQHDELASNVIESRLADDFHAQAALRTERVRNRAAARACRRDGTPSALG
jgi:hypothetical protein